MSSRKRWGVIAAALVFAVAAGAGAFALVGGRDEKQTADAPEPAAESEPAGEAQAPPEPEPVEQLPCTRREASRALDRGELGDAVSGQVEGIPSEMYELELVGCRDLDGDGLDEMVMVVRWGTAASPSPWAVLSQREGRWRAAVVRERVVVSKLHLTDGGVREVSAAFARDDQLCCPSGRRTGTLAHEDGEWVYTPKDLGADGLEVTFDGPAPLAIAGVELSQASPDQLVGVLGTPSAVFAEGTEVCTHHWSDLGLIVNFANLGGSDACGPDGRIGSLTVGGSEAVHAGWRVDGRARVGDNKQKLKGLYPAMHRPGYDLPRQDPFEGKAWVLLEQETNIGEAGTAPTLEARINGGEARAFDITVGAAGE